MMEENKVLSENELENVSGGLEAGEFRTLEFCCPNCGHVFASMRIRSGGAYGFSNRPDNCPNCGPIVTTIRIH